MDWSDVFARVGGYDIGNWYLLEESCTGWSAKERRPWIMVAEYTGGTIAKMRPRTTTGRRGLWHPAHPRGHVPGCAITEDGRIPPRVVMVDVDCLLGHFSCHEPDEAVVEACRG